MKTFHFMIQSPRYAEYPFARLTLLLLLSLGATLMVVQQCAAASFEFANTGSLILPRTNHTATLLPNNQVLVAGGFHNAVNGSAELYDPVTGAWTATGNLRTKRGRHTATLLPDGKVLVAGGSDGNGYLSDAELYDPATGTWTPTGSLLTPRLGPTATLLQNGKVLVAGGAYTDYLSTAELYDPATGVWTA